jgi:hypothetical protein
MKKTLVLTAVLLALLAVPSAWGEDEEGTRWLLKMEHGPLRIVSVPGDSGEKVTYHYMTFKVTNPTTLARDWYPVVWAITDTNKKAPAAGYEAALPVIRAKEGNDGLIPIAETKGKIQAGQTIQAVAIFGPLDPLYDRVRVQFRGLTKPIAIYKIEKYPVTIEMPDEIAYYKKSDEGELEKVEEALIIQDVAYVERNAEVMKLVKKETGSSELPDAVVEYWEVSERRVYEMIYTRLGDEYRPDDDLISFEKEHWTISGDVKLLRKIEM